MDFLISTAGNGGGRCALTRAFLDQAGGAFWDANGDLRREMGAEYVKATQFELDPIIKSEPYEGQLYERNPAYVYNNYAHISIDGERYKS